MQNPAFDHSAPADERFDALSQLQKSHAPTSESGLILPPSQLAEIAAEVRAGMMEMEMHKAVRDNVVPFPSHNVEKRKPGMQSVFLDDLQISVVGDYWERPSPLAYESMRAMVDQTPVLSAVVLTRVRQVQRFCRVQESGEGAGFTIRHVDAKHQLTESERDSVETLSRFFTNCGMEFSPRRRRALKRDAFTQMMAKSVRDSLVLDSAPIETEFKRNTKLGIDGFYAVDGATMRLCSEAGYQGEDEIFALQVVQGRIRSAYTRDDLILEPRNPRSDVNLAGYGLSEVELLVRIVTGFLNALTLNLRGFSDNSVPRGIMHLTGNYSNDDLAAFRRYWNSMVKGVNNAWTVPVMVSKDQESKAAFEPIGVQFDEMYFSKWMTFLTSIICAVYGMSPDEINFESFAVGKSSLSGSDTAEKLADSKDKGLRPLLSYYESIFTDYVVSAFDEKYCFRWTGLDEEDEEKRHEMRKLVLTVNEVRAEEGYEAHDDDMLGNAPLNPSLTGLYMQAVQQQAQDFGGGEQSEDGDQGGPGGAPQPEEKRQKPPAQEGDADPGEQDAIQKSMTLDFGQREPAIHRLGDAWQ